MAGEFSFDVVSEFDAQELRNALDQVRREIATRFDFKGATAEITQEKDALAIVADNDITTAKIISFIFPPLFEQRTQYSCAPAGL